MTGLVEDFLNEAVVQLSDLEGFLPILEKNPTQKECWDALYDFFGFIRSVAPFAGFSRSYRIADAAVKEIREYFEKEQNTEILLAVLKKYKRIRDILLEAERLKREVRAYDDDILPPEESDEKDAFPVKTAPLAPDIISQATELDKREEELVLWAQALTEQEKALKRKENILFKEENIQDISQRKITEALNQISEQKKIQNDLEERLHQTRSALRSCEEKLANQEDLNKASQSLLETKENVLEEMNKKIQDLNRSLQEKSILNKQREEQLYQELQENLKQNEELRNSLNLLEDARSEIGEDRNKIFLQYSELELEYQKTLQSLNEEKENKERVLKEKRELEKQHLEFNSRMVMLQEELGVEKENMKHTEMLLEQQKWNNNLVQSELRAAGWPYNVEKIQKELAVLARQEGKESAKESLIALRDLLCQIRTRSFIKMPHVFKSIVQAAAKQYQRPYHVYVDCNVNCGVDQDALIVLEQMLLQLVDNSFRYAYPKENGGILNLSFQVQDEGAYLHCIFSDNGGAFDFDRLYAAVLSRGLLNEDTPVERLDLLAYMFHNHILFRRENRGLFDSVQLLEKAGGQIRVCLDKGMKIDFFIPKKFLFDTVLLFKVADRLLAVPMNAVSETVFFKGDEIKEDSETKTRFFYWKGLSVPVLKLDGEEHDGFGLVIQAGIFTFLLPVQQILDAEHMLSFSDESSDLDCRYLIPCTVLESGKELLWLDIAELLQQVALPLPKKILSISDNEKKKDEKSISYLIFKSEPSVFGAVRVDAVLRVEDFPVSKENTSRLKFLETQGEKLPLKDLCPDNHFSYAQAVLILKTQALAIQEVVDIIDISNTAENNIDFILYHGRNVPVFSPEA